MTVVGAVVTGTCACPSPETAHASARPAANRIMSAFIWSPSRWMNRFSPWPPRAPETAAHRRAPLTSADTSSMVDRDAGLARREMTGGELLAADRIERESGTAIHRGLHDVARAEPGWRRRRGARADRHAAADRRVRGLDDVARRGDKLGRTARLEHEPKCLIARRVGQLVRSELRKLAARERQRFDRKYLAGRRDVQHPHAARQRRPVVDEEAL